jgi:hypothetical protein
MDYGMDIQDSTACRSKIFLLSIASAKAPGPTQPPIQWVKGQGGEADHSFPASAKDKNGGAEFLLPHTSS